MKKDEASENLLPQIIEKKLELGLNGSKISLKDFEIASGKTTAELTEAFSEKICSLPAVRAQAIWTALDQESKFELTYPDYGMFNFSLVEKLNLRGNTLQEAFVSIHARSIFELDTAPLLTPAYVNAFRAIQSELLATSKQLFTSKPDGKERLIEFLNGFETDFLANVVRHEIAKYFIDEQGAQLEFDLVEKDSGDTAFIENEEPNDDISDDTESYLQQDPLEEFNNTFIKGGMIPSSLEFASWIQHYTPEIFSTVRSFLVFFAAERGVAVWERPNPTEQEEDELAEQKIELKNSTGEDRFRPDLATAFRERASGNNELVSVESEKEFRRLIRIYCITTPLKNDFLKVGQQNFEAQGTIIARILKESGMQTNNIQTFEQLRKAACDAVGFTSIKQWAYKQDNPERLINSSGSKWIFDEMKVLGNGAFNTDAIFFDGLEKSRGLVLRLFGWLNLVKIFWNVADQKPRFTDLATIKNDTLYWEENITCCTLIFQLVLETDKLFFSLPDIKRFCKLSRNSEWVDTMKQSFRDMAEQNNAISAVQIFDEYINHLSKTATNIFRIANDIHLSTKAEREYVAAVKGIAEDHFNIFLQSLGNNEKTEKELRSEVGFLFVFEIAQIPQIRGCGKEAESYLNYLFDQLSISSDISSKEIDNIPPVSFDIDELKPNSKDAH